MTGRERIEAAFTAEGSRDLPAVICYESVFLRDHWSQLTRHPWWYLHAPEPERQVAWSRDVAAGIGQDWLQMFPWTSLEDEEYRTIEIQPDGVFVLDRRTGRREELAEPTVGGAGSEWGQPATPTDLPESPEEVDARIPVPGEGEGDTVAIENRRRVAAAVREALGKTIWLYRHVSSPFWKTYDLFGFEGLMTLTATRPELVKRACERYLQAALRNVREAAEHGAAGIWIEECFTDLISPAAYAELNKPFLGRLIDAIREAGMKSIYYFCGNPAGKWDLILSMNMDALGMEESKKNFRTEIEEIVEQVQGRCTLLGNLDAVGVLQNGSEERLRAEIRRHVEAGRRNGSRFILSLGSPVTPDTPVERVRLYCDLAHELGSGG